MTLYRPCPICDAAGDHRMVDVSRWKFHLGWHQVKHANRYGLDIDKAQQISMEALLREARAHSGHDSRLNQYIHEHIEVGKV